MPALASRGLGLATRGLHWLSVVLVAAAFGLAWSFNTLPRGDTAGRLVEVHRSVGLSILAVTAMRLGWRALHPLPPVPEAPHWEIWLARSVQAGLYLCLIAMPVLGWAGSSAQGDAVVYLGQFPMPDLVDVDPDRADRIFVLHERLGFVLLGLLSLHVAGALRHGLIKRDGVLRRMVTGRSLG